MSGRSPASTSPSAPNGAETSSPPDAGTDALSRVGWVMYLLLGGCLVFGFAASVWPAAQALEGAACRPLKPQSRQLPAPDFDLVDMAGKARKFSEFRGKFVVLNFWATWCEPCIREWPDLDRLAQRFEGDDRVVVIAVSLDEDAEQVRAFIDRLALDASQVLVLRDPTTTANKLFGSEKLPDTFFIDESGMTTHAFINVRPWGRPDAYRCVDSRLGLAG